MMVGGSLKLKRDYRTEVTDPVDLVVVGDPDLLPVTVPEVRRLLAALVRPPPHDPVRVLAWSRWWRRHQQRAQGAHYRRRGAQT